MRIRFALLALASCLLVNATTGATQPVMNLSALTVPPDRLPPGCMLAPEDRSAANPPQGAAVVAAPPGIMAPTNPWVGTDRQIVAAIRQRIEGARPEPDGPPLDLAAAAAYRLKWADHVVEAYRARYRSGDESAIDVFAVRFDDEALASPTPPAGKTRVRLGVANRLVMGPTVVLVSAVASNGCFQRINEYVASLR
jgi:hypothetical protein